MDGQFLHFSFCNSVFQVNKIKFQKVAGLTPKTFRNSINIWKNKQIMLWLILFSSVLLVITIWESTSCHGRIIKGYMKSLHWILTTHFLNLSHAKGGKKGKLEQCHLASTQIYWHSNPGQLNFHFPVAPSIICANHHVRPQSIYKNICTMYRNCKN